MEKEEEWNWIEKLDAEKAVCSLWKTVKKCEFEKTSITIIVVYTTEREGVKSEFFSYWTLWNVWKQTQYFPRHRVHLGGKNIALKNYQLSEKFVFIELFMKNHKHCQF